MDQLNLFPLSALQTEGFAQPESRDIEDDFVVEADVEIKDVA